MVDFPGSESQKTLDQVEHNVSAKAKRVVNGAINSDSGSYESLALPPINEQFDYIDIANTGANEDTLTYKLGGSGGTTVKTMVIGYASGADKVSDNLTSLSFS